MVILLSSSAMKDLCRTNGATNHVDFNRSSNVIKQNRFESLNHFLVDPPQINVVAYLQRRFLHFITSKRSLNQNALLLE